MRKLNLIVILSSTVIAINLALSAFQLSYAQQPKIELQKIPVFKEFSAGPPRKEAFFEFMAQLIHQSNQQILEDRKKLTSISMVPNEKQLSWLNNQAKQYRLKTFDAFDKNQRLVLKKRMDIIPVTLALAQAANESAWGTSRFARKAHNYFGQWCFSKGCGLVPLRRSAGAVHEVRSFKHPYYSVKSYIRNLNSHPTYQKLRDIRFKARQKGKKPSGILMAHGLVNYSERKEEYVKELQSMIRYNKLQRFELIEKNEK